VYFVYFWLVVLFSYTMWNILITGTTWYGAYVELFMPVRSFPAIVHGVLVEILYLDTIPFLLVCWRACVELRVLLAAESHCRPIGKLRQAQRKAQRRAHRKMLQTTLLLQQPLPRSLYESTYHSRTPNQPTLEAIVSQYNNATQ